MARDFRFESPTHPPTWCKYRNSSFSWLFGWSTQSFVNFVLLFTGKGYFVYSIQKTATNQDGRSYKFTTVEIEKEYLKNKELKSFNMSIPPKIFKTLLLAGQDIISELNQAGLDV